MGKYSKNMTPEERITNLEKQIADMKNVSTFNLDMERTLRARGFVKGSKQALAGTKIYYVASASGGSPTTKLTFVDGILNSEV